MRDRVHALLIAGTIFFIGNGCVRDLTQQELAELVDPRGEAAGSVGRSHIRELRPDDLARIRGGRIPCKGEAKVFYAKGYRNALIIESSSKVLLVEDPSIRSTYITEVEFLNDGIIWWKQMEPLTQVVFRFSTDKQDFTHIRRTLRDDDPCETKLR